MKNLHDIIQKNMEEFDEIAYPVVRSELIGDEKALERLKSHLLSSQLSIIQAIDEWVEKKQAPLFLQQDGMSKDWLQEDAYKVALSDLRSFLEEAKTKLK